MSRALVLCVLVGMSACGIQVRIGKWPDAGTAGGEAERDAGGGAGGSSGGSAGGSATAGGTADAGRFIFPPTPIFDGTAPANAPALFAGGSDAGIAGPCLIEPPVGAMVPRNFLRPLFSWSTADPLQNLFELRLHAASEPNDLVVYTTNPQWTMPLPLWNEVRQNLNGVPIEISVRSGRRNGTGLLGPVRQGSSGPFTIAPVDAEGSIVYWSVRPDAGASIKGFYPGDEAVRTVIRPAQVSNPINGDTAVCVACHAATPDGLSIAVTTTDTDPYNTTYLSIVGDAGFVTPVARQLLFPGGYVMGMSFSASHWSNGDHTLLTNWQGNLLWVDLEATDAGSFGFINRSGDPRAATQGSFSHDGRSIVYASGASVVSFFFPSGGSDLYTVPYGGRAGGVAAPIAGASLAGYSEAFPSFSPDDRLVVYSRTPDGPPQESNPLSEIFIADLDAGTAMRAAANDPSACSGKVSPGAGNSWATWSPRSATVGTDTYYWFAFSSRRSDPGLPQVYLSAVVRTAAGLVTYPAVHMWNQPPDESNHGPTWDVLQLR